MTITNGSIKIAVPIHVRMAVPAVKTTFFMLVRIFSAKGKISFHAIELSPVMALKIPSRPIRSQSAVDPAMAAMGHDQNK
jgi:hypothetical protein